MTRSALHAFQAMRQLGPRWLAYRIGYAAQLRTGALRRRTPTVAWDDIPLAEILSQPELAQPHVYLEYRRTRAPGFFFDAAQRAEFQPLFAQWDDQTSTPQQIGAKLAAGTFRYFEHEAAELGCPPDWHANPFTGQRIAAEQHWSQISDFGSGDIKVIWEPSRFGFTYALVRAYWRTGDEQYAELFWQLLEDWRAHNPPQLGPNWKCGQETSLRVMAWCFGMYGFLHAAASSATRVATLAQMVAVSGQRIAANLSYALSQRNNHGISEGLGLWTIGALFPELRGAAEWRAKGRDVLEALGRELIYDDGAFIQHSLNYHRLMAHDYIWAIGLGDCLHDPLSDELRAQVGRAAELLYQLQDESSGLVPNYGHNDGALVLPLDNCDYSDFRPVIQATRYLATGKRTYGPGAWDESLLWMFGAKALAAPLDAPARIDLQATTGGYYTMRAAHSFAFVRAAILRDRPGQADMLHTDIFWRGQPITLDPGTYSYNAPAPWNNELAHTRYHNTVTVDDCDQMDQIGKFLWSPWLTSKVYPQRQLPGGTITVWEGEHDGYRRLNAPARHRRCILHLGDDRWLVLDALASSEVHRYRLHWLFADLPHLWDASAGRLELNTGAGAYHIHVGASLATRQTLISADEHSPCGWWSPYYYTRKPALSLDCSAEARAMMFWTIFSPLQEEVRAQDSTLHIQNRKQSTRVTWSNDFRKPLIEVAFVKHLLK